MIYSAKKESRTCLLLKNYYFLSLNKRLLFIPCNFLAFVLDKKEFAANITLAKK